MLMKMMQGCVLGWVYEVFWDGCTGMGVCNVLGWCMGVLGWVMGGYMGVLGWVMGV